MMWSLFELSLGRTEDALRVDGIARHVHEVDTAFVNTRTVPEILKQLGDSKDSPEWILRWSGPKSFILVVYGLPDTSRGAPGRVACEQRLDLLLAALNVLKVERIEDLVAEVSASVLPETLGGVPEAKRGRWE